MVTIDEFDDRDKNVILADNLTDCKVFLQIFSLSLNLS